MSHSHSTTPPVDAGSQGNRTNHTDTREDTLPRSSSQSQTMGNTRHPLIPAYPTNAYNYPYQSSNYTNNLPPPYLPLEYPPALSPHPRPTQSASKTNAYTPLLTYSSNPVTQHVNGYPPIQPEYDRPSALYPTSSLGGLGVPNDKLFGRRESLSLSIPALGSGSWSSAPGTNTSRPSHPSPIPEIRPSPAASPDHMRGIKRQQGTSTEDVQAGLVLADLGNPRIENAVTGRELKKIKSEEKPLLPLGNGTKKGEKDGRKSCSECRRLKAKCDRVFPCSNCRRRGCALVCPDGDLSCMQGKRLVLASTEQLHERIAQLESALAQAYTAKSNVPHPLLAPQYLDGGFASLPFDSALTRTDSPNHPTGTSGRSTPKDLSSASSITLVTPNLSSERYTSQGRMAVGSLLLSEDAAAAEGRREDEWVGENAAPALIVGTVGNSPIEAKEAQNTRSEIVERLRGILTSLPIREEAAKRANHFWKESIWYNNILRPSEYNTIYEPAVYAPTPANPLTPHKLACVLIVLTLDTYLDLSVEDENPDVGKYWDGVQRCFDTRFGWSASVAGVQALGLITLFVGFGWKGARASNFHWLRLMTSAAQQLGLHKDPHPSLPEDEREFRRRVFHECYTIDCLVSMTHGQRTAIPVENIEALAPRKECTPLEARKYQYMRLVKSAVTDMGCRPDSAPASWEQITTTEQIMMQTDPSHIPEIHCPVLTGSPMPPIADDPTRFDPLGLLQFTTSICHFKAMLFLFRPSLRRLIARLRTTPRENVVFDEADHKVVSMTYYACRSTTANSMFMTRTHPRLSARCWSVWVQTFSAAVSVAALAIWCSPHMEPRFAKSAYEELSNACAMINENGGKRSQGVLSLLPILQSLVHNRYPHVIGGDPSTAKISTEGEDMLFALLGGQVEHRSVPGAPVHPGQPIQSHNEVEIGQLPPVPTAPFVPSQDWQPPHPQQQLSHQQWTNYSAQAHQQPQQVLQYNAFYQNQPNQFPHHQAEFAGLDLDFRVEDMSAGELWERLQSFYEPGAGYWGNVEGGV